MGSQTLFAGNAENVILGIPQSVLSGGRYDLMMKKMGRQVQALGFAVYLDQLDRLMDEQDAYDVDLLITYGKDAQWESIIAAVQKAQAEGETVRVQPEGETALRSRRMIRM